MGSPPRASRGSAIHVFLVNFALKLHSVSEVFKRPTLFKASFSDIFFWTTAGGKSIYSQGTTTQLTFLLNYRWNIYIQISILQQIETAVLFICISSIHVLFIDAQISATTATPCTNRRRQRLVACDVYIPILHCIGQALTLCKFVGRESRAGAHQHKYNQAEKLKQKKKK